MFNGNSRFLRVIFGYSPFNFTVIMVESIQKGVLNMDKKTIGSFISVLRKSKGLTQKDFGDMLGVSDKTVSRWERDECAPDITLIPVIADIFDVTADELLRGEKRNDFSPIPEVNELSQKSERSILILLERAYAKFKTKSLISVCIATVGIFGAAICNYAFTRSYLGFIIAALMIFVAVIFQIITAINSKANTVISDVCDITDTSAFTRKLLFITFYVIALEISMLLSCIPLLFSGDAYFGITFESWLLYGILGFAIGLLLSLVISVIFENILIKREIITADETQLKKLKLKTKILLICLITLVITAVIQFALNIFGSELFLNSNIYTPEEFVELAETPEAFEYFDSMVGSEIITAIINEGIEYTDNQTTDDYYTEIPKEQIFDKNGSLICEFNMLNENIVHYELKYDDNNKPYFIVNTNEDFREMNTAKNDINEIFVFIYLFEIIIFVVIYLKKSKKFI